MAPTDWRNPRLAELKAAGGKVIVYHGASDGAFSLQATIDWYDKLRANNGGDVSDFARFYPVPGMTHCDGGPATDRFDAFGALVALGRARYGARQPRGQRACGQRGAAGELEQDAVAAAVRLAESRALPRRRRRRSRPRASSASKRHESRFDGDNDEPANHRKPLWFFLARRVRLRPSRYGRGDGPTADGSAATDRSATAGRGANIERGAGRGGPRSGGTAGRREQQAARSSRHGPLPRDEGRGGYRCRSTSSIGPQI